MRYSNTALSGVFFQLLGVYPSFTTAASDEELSGNTDPMNQHLVFLGEINYYIYKKINDFNTFNIMEVMGYRVNAP
jgi:hypothetical protein